MAETIPINIHWNGQDYSVTPKNPNIAKGGTARFNSNRGCTVYFTPTTTPFGASVNVPANGSTDVAVGNSDYSVQYRVADSGATAQPMDSSGTIKVGSGMTAQLMDSSGTIKVGSG